MSSEQLVATVPKDFNRKSGKLVCYDDQGNALQLDFKVANVRVKKSKEEILLAKRLYRREYQKRPGVKEKLQAKLNNPETKKKRMEYASRPDVIARKKQVAAQNRKIRNLLKQEKPDIYKELQQKAVHV